MVISLVTIGLRSGWKRM